MSRSPFESEQSRILTPTDLNTYASSSAHSLRSSNHRPSKNVLQSIVSNSTLKSNSFLSEKHQLTATLDQRRPSAQIKTTTKMNRSVMDDRMPSPEGSAQKQNNLSVSFFNIQKAALKNQLRVGTSDARTNISKTLSTSLMSASPTKHSERSKLGGSLVKKIEEKCKAVEVNKQIMKESLDCREQRKEIESQVTALETRIAKLKHEEEEVMKRVQKVKEDTEKTMENKKRRQEDLLLKEQFYKQKQEEMRKRKEKATNIRVNVKTNVHQAKINNLENKYNTALHVKTDNNNYKSIKETIEKQKSEKNKMLVRRVSELHESVKAKKIDKEINGMNKFTEKSVNQMNKDKETAEKLAKRYQELADYEQEMLERLGRTYELHKSQVSELEQISTMRVEECFEDRIKPYKKI